ncbi:MAG TPA: SRPBCC domain-containing protein [Myxococcaceae bacterium]|nr:SRPBCC domain-containing protein [Myxococcaceae bacterium]
MSDSPPKTRSLVLEAHLPGTPDELARMLTDPLELARWFAPFVEGPGTPGALVTFRWSPDMVWKTRPEIIEPGRRVLWRDAPPEEQPGGPPGATMVIEWSLAAEAGGTRLRLVHSGFGEGAEWEDQYDATNAGWRFFLWHLEETLRHHRGADRAVVWERRASGLSRDALGERLFGPAGLALSPARPAPGTVAHLSLGGTPRRFEVANAHLPTHLWGKFPGLGGAILLVEMEPGRTGPFHTGLWLSTWGLAPDVLASLRAGLRAMADAVFGPPPG